MTGDYTILSVILNEADAITMGIYVLEYFAEMNPNLESRDHVNATVESR